MLAVEWTSGAWVLWAGSVPVARLVSIPVSSSPKSITCHWCHWCCFKVFKCKGMCHISGAVGVSGTLLRYRQRTSKMDLRAAVLSLHVDGKVPVATKQLPQAVMSGGLFHDSFCYFELISSIASSRFVLLFPLNSFSIALCSQTWYLQQWVGCCLKI